MTHETDRNFSRFTKAMLTIQETLITHGWRYLKSKSSFLEVSLNLIYYFKTIACNFHDETGDVVGSFKLSGGDDAEHAIWLELKSDLKLFASHVDFLREVAILRNANW